MLTPSYHFQRSWRTTQIRIAVQNTGIVKVTIPFFVPRTIAEQFVQSQQRWILEKIAIIHKKESVLKNHQPYRTSKAAARAYIRDLITQYTQKYHFTYNRLSIKNHTSRWGSCSQKKNLNFNYKILFLPRALAEYIIVHELCHLEHLNHSQNFWDHVGKIIPDYKKRRKELKEKF